MSVHTSSTALLHFVVFEARIQNLRKHFHEFLGEGRATVFAILHQQCLGGTIDADEHSPEGGGWSGEGKRHKLNLFQKPWKGIK